jgi:hypothetical protein
VEDAIEKNYATLPLDREFIDEVRVRLDQVLQDDHRLIRQSRTNLAKELATLEGKEERLIGSSPGRISAAEKVRNGCGPSRLNGPGSRTISWVPTSGSPSA